jgi:hypothetical protein
MTAGKPGMSPSAATAGSGTASASTSTTAAAGRTAAAGGSLAAAAGPIGVAAQVTGAAYTRAKQIAHSHGPRVDPEDKDEG